MKQMQTVGTVSKSLGISSRMLRYYEKIGLIESGRMEDYAYRVYDEAAICTNSEDIEDKTMGMISKFVNDSGLLHIKPDVRGFVCSPEYHGLDAPMKIFEAWISIPDDMEVPAPFEKQQFNGGLYAAHILRDWDFQDWRRLGEWVNASDKYINDWNSPRRESQKIRVGKGFEEILNFYHFNQSGNMESMQLDLLFPIKEKGEAQ